MAERVGNQPNLTLQSDTTQSILNLEKRATGVIVNACLPVPIIIT